MHWRITIVCVLILVVAGCNEAATNTDSNGMAQQSELAALMRVMESHGDAVRDALKNGTEIPGKPVGIENLLQAAPTPNMNIHEGTFHVFVQQYLESVEALYAAAEEDRSTAYNAIIQSCSNCHQMNCPGPLMKIEKMFVAE